MKKVSELDGVDDLDDDDIFHIVRLSEPDPEQRNRAATWGQIAANILARVPEPLEVPPAPEPPLPPLDLPELEEEPPLWLLPVAAVCAGALGGGAVVAVLRLFGL